MMSSATEVYGVQGQGGSWRNYHALMRCTDGRDPVEAVTDQIGAWLREKRIDLDLRHDNDFETADRSFEIRYHQRDRGHDVKAILCESTRLGDWRSEIIASADGWVEIAVSNSQGRFVDVPRVAKYLMQALPLGDAGLNFVDHAETWDSQYVSDLVELLTEPQRSAPVFVAGMGEDGDLARPFASRVDTWIKQTYGLAQTIILTPRACHEASAALGAHAIHPWSIRTFLPRVELGSEWDARRHRYLLTATLGKRPDRQIIELLGAIARGQTAERPVGAEVAKVHRIFQRLADQELTHGFQEPAAFVPIPRSPDSPITAHELTTDEAATQTIGVVAPDNARDGDESSEAVTGHLTDVAALQEQLTLVRSILGVKEINASALSSLAEAANLSWASPSLVQRMDQRLAELREQIAAQDSSLEELRAAVTDHEINTAIAEEAASKATSEALWLRQQLSERGSYEAAYAVAPDASCPQDISGLVEVLPEGIEFTGSSRDLDDVDERDSLHVCVRVAWDAVLAMADYLRARGTGLISGSFHEYVRNTPSGFRGFPPAKSAENETGVTTERFGAQRVFRVPSDVSPDESVMMNAHIKLGRIGMASPRMHYYHHAQSNRIFIGYIGLHLQNTMSN